MSDRCVRLADTPFDVDAAAAAFRQSVPSAGAVASFIGQVSPESGDNPVEALFLDHMPEASLASIKKIASAAEARWPLLKLMIIHRVGRVETGQPIVFVACASRHRRESFEAVEFVMDFLKSDVLLWKKEIRATSQTWIEPKTQDFADKQRWETEICTE
jgi:molybdopterin synthase catalytic subunit